MYLLERGCSSFQHSIVGVTHFKYEHDAASLLGKSGFVCNLKHFLNLPINLHCSSVFPKFFRSTEVDYWRRYQRQTTGNDQNKVELRYVVSVLKEKLKFCETTKKNVVTEPNLGWGHRHVPFLYMNSDIMLFPFIHQTCHF